MATRKPVAKKSSRPSQPGTRKRRTIARLRREKIPVLESLPNVEDERDVQLRSRDEIVDRAIALLAVAAKGLGAPADRLKRFAVRFAVAKKLSPDEKAFWKKSRPSETDKRHFPWRYEALRVLLWSLGFERKLPRPNKQGDPAALGSVISERGPETFRQEAKLRPAEEILDLADLMYRYHWAIRDAQLKNRKAPKGLDPDIVMEWDHAVRWLVGYMDQDWDDVTLDT